MAARGRRRTDAGHPAICTCRPGQVPKLVSFRLPGHPTWTVASLTTPNRATLITLTLDEDVAHISHTFCRSVTS